MIRGIIFDYGGVFNRQHETLRGFAAAARRLGRSDQELYDLLYSGPDWQAARVGQLSAQAFWRRMMARLDHPGDDVAGFLAELFAGDAIDQEVVRIAETLRRRFPLVLLSNALDDLEVQLAEQHGLAHLFVAVVNSAVVGVAKPEPRAFALALEALGLPAAEAVLIDDKARNVAAAVALGLPAIHYTTPAALAADLHARGLLDEPVLAGGPR